MQPLKPLPVPTFMQPTVGAMLLLSLGLGRFPGCVWIWYLPTAEFESWMTELPLHAGVCPAHPIRLLKQRLAMNKLMEPLLERVEVSACPL